MSKAIIYDGECPLCAAYTGRFVKSGILKPGERLAFSELQNQEFLNRLDPAKQGNEIPLVDLDGGPTLYGIDSMLFLLSKRFPGLSKISRNRSAYLFFRAMYGFVSYNRRIILAKPYRKLKFSCAPGFHAGYRIAFLVFASLFSACITWAFGERISAADELKFLNGWKAILVCGPGWLLTLFAGCLWIPGREKRLDYFGHLGMLQIGGVAVLIPATLVPFSGSIAFLFPVASVMLSSAIMLRGHIRRAELAGLSQRWTFLWMLLMQLSAAGILFSFYK
jgi:hypothetical protein